uniref:Transglycosylase SLT domain-containing protein n=2 Tax=Lotus japonicus TaxID=34305 RepID=I3SDY8_LOTJA|nr:unknown [Lotus japonicus]
MEAMWNHPEIHKVWSKSKQKQGKVRFTHDEKKRPYLSRVEIKAVADIVLFKYLNTLKIKSRVLCAIAEVASTRFVDGVEGRPGIMGIDYSTAFWLYLELGHRAYKLESADDLNSPFVSMYFGAAYVAWLSEYEGRERAPQFFVQAYFVGPKNVNPQDVSPLWLKFEESLSKYEETKRSGDSCSIM